MDYEALRERFVELSGRYDLVDSSWNDSGADFFINAGQRYLDRLVEHQKSLARSYNAITAGDVHVKVADLEAVKEVWVVNADGKHKLIKKTITELRDTYYECWTEIPRNIPKYYALAVFRPSPDESSDDDLSAHLDTTDIITTVDEDGPGHYTYNGVVFMPPADGGYTLTVWGKFMSPKLTAKVTDSTWVQTRSYWTEVHPDILIEAALMKLEGFYRNTEGLKDWNNFLSLDLLSLDRTLADQEMSDVFEMEG